MDEKERQGIIERNAELSMQLVRYAKEEQERRKDAPVHIKGGGIAHDLEAYRHIWLVDPRIGSNNRVHRLWIDAIPPHTEEGENEWKTLGHRHTVEAIIYFLKGHGHSIIDGVRYDWGPGDLICVPMFAWHRHINEGDEPALRIASTTGPLSMGIGQAVYEDERYPEYWVYAQKGEEAMRTLIPGGTEVTSRAMTEADGAGALYAEELAFAMAEENRRRQSKVLVKGSELKFESSAMGRRAYMVDPRIGFHVKVLSVVMAEIPPGKRSGAHRHLYDEIDYVISGRGRAVIDDKEYLLEPGDVLSMPVFAWHQYFNTGDEPLKIIAPTTRPGMENLGLALTQQGELADH